MGNDEVGLARRGRGALSVLVWLAVASCGSPERGSGPPPASVVRAESRRPASTGSEVVEPPAPAELAGAAAMPPEPEVPRDTTALASRFTPKPLGLPRVRAGQSARFTFDGQRPGWFARTPDGSQSLLTPIYGEGRVYLGGGFTSHALYAYDARTGEMRWAAQAPDGGPSAAIVEDGKVLFTTESCTLFAVDARTGRQRWSRWLGDPLMSQPAARNGRVYSGHIKDGGGYGFTAMDVRNGRVLWSRNITADVMNAAVLDEESIYFTTMDGIVWRLNQHDGRVVWRQRLRATSAPWLEGEHVHVTLRDAREHEGRRVQTEIGAVLAKADGQKLREHEQVDASFLPSRPDAGGVPAGWSFEGSRPTIVDGRLYQTIGNEVHCRDATTGELLWRRQYTTASRTRPATPPAIAGSQLVFGTRDGVLYGLDIDTGMTTWAYEVGEPISAQPTVAHGWVFASTTRGGVVALNVGDAELDGWHMWGGNAMHNGRVAQSEPIAEDVERPTEGVLQLSREPRDGELAGFPLRGTRVSARVSGFVTRVTVEQTFENPYSRPVEAVYLFPLPEDSAVDGMEMRAGDRTIVASIFRRHEARERYDDARERGVLASLLEQERPNLFRQSVANIRPGDTVRVTLRYTQALPYEEGSYRFVYPMVAGPRYQPEGQDGAPNSAPNSAPGQGSEATEQIVLTPGAERPDRVEVEIVADVGTELRDVTSPTHAIDVRDRAGSRAQVRLREPARPDRDLDVRFTVAGDAPSIAVLASPPEGAPSEGGEPRGQERGHFSLALHPRMSVADGEVLPRELVFLVDTSSSMNGRPLELAKAAMDRALSGLRPTDTFRVLAFSDRAAPLSDEALPATPENVERARRFVRDLRALGTTEMIRGLRAALEPRTSAGRMRIVLLMTDGYVGNETEIFREVHQRLGQSRVFAFGVGSAVNRYLLTRVAEVGRGDVQTVTLDESPADAADAFHRRIARPYLTDVTIDWNGLPVSDAYPRRLPDLFADRPLVVHARYAQAASAEVIVRGRIGGRPYEQRVQVTLPATVAGDDPRSELSSIWARTRVRDLMTAMALAPNEALQEEVTMLGLRHHLLTQWTAFVAIDETRRVESASVRVHQPSSVPAGQAPAANVPAAQTRPATTSASAVRRILPARMPASPSRGFGGMGIGYGGGGMGGVRGDVLDAWDGPTARPAPEAAVAAPAERPLARPREERSRAGNNDCYQQARRPDGTIDQAALEDCLRRQRERMERTVPFKSAGKMGHGPVAVLPSRDRRAHPARRWRASDRSRPSD